MSEDQDQPRREVQSFNPFAKSEVSERNTGVQTAASRANTEVLAMVMSAKQFPRDMIRVTDKILNAFTRPTLAEKSQYAFARGGTNITGPSIRAAEAISQQWGNMSNGWRELSRYKGPDGVGVSECEAYSIDYESNSRESIQFVVRHWRDTKSGGYALKEERDIYELCANQSQRRKRACILAQVPGDVVDAAMNQAAVTLAATADTSPEAIASLEKTFAEFGVTRELIEAKIQRRLESIQPAQVVMLKRIYLSLRDEMSNPQDWFDIAPEAVKTAGLDAVRAAAKQKREQKKKGGAAPAAATDAVKTADAATAAPAVAKAGELIDPQSGEISSPTDPTVIVFAAMPDNPAAGDESAEVARSIRDVEKAVNKDSADTALAFASDTLSEAGLAKVRDAYVRKWG